MSERNSEKVSEIVSRWAHAIAETTDEKKQKFTPEKLEKRVQKLEENIPKNKTESRGSREQREAKEFVDKVQESQKSITSTMKEWNEQNKYKNVVSIEQAKKKLDTALGLSKNKPSWSEITSANEIEHSAAAAEYLSTLALLPKNLVEDPNIFFHETARFAASMSSDPKARAEEIKILNKAIGHIKELRDNFPEKGLNIGDEDLIYTLRGYVLYDDSLDIPTAQHQGTLLTELQDKIEARGRNSTEQEIKYLEGIANKLADGDVVELEDGKRQFYKVNKKELKKYIDRTNRRIDELNIDKNREYRETQRKDEVIWSDLSEEQQKKVWQHPDNEPLNLYGFTPREQELLLSGDMEKIREFFSDFIAGIYGVGREQKHPELPDQNKFDRFKTALEWIFGDDSELVKVQFEMAWSDRGKQEYTLKQLAYAPGDIKDKLMAFRKLLGADLDYYATYNEWAPLAINFMQDAIPMAFARKQGRYNEALEYVLKQDKLEEIPDFLKTVLDIKKTDTELNNDGLFVKYQEALKNGLLEGDKFSPEQKIILDKFKNTMEGKLKSSIDTVGFGVQLFDDEVLIYNEARIQWITAEQRLVELRKIPSSDLTQQQKNELDNLPQFIKKKSEQVTRLQERDKIFDAENKNVVERYQEFSPLEAEVLDMLEDYLTSRGIKPEELLSQRWKVRDAIWAARMHAIGSGHLVDLNAYMVTRPKNVDLKSYAYTDNGRYTMISPFMEDIQRIINPELFAWRFGMGGAMGERAFALLRSGQYPKEKKMTESDAWWEDEKNVTNPETRRVRRMMEYAEQRMGISFSELLGSGFMKGGTYFDATAWRLDEGLMTQIRNAMVESNMSPEAWENAALGLQLIVAGDQTARKRILEKMVKRTPLVFVEFMAGKQMNAIYKKFNVLEKDQILFQRILSKAQTRLWDDKSLVERSVNLSSEKDFNEIVAPFLDQVGGEAIGKKNLFRSMIEEVQKMVTEVPEEFKNKRESFLSEWSKGQMPMTLALSGIDWSKSFFAKLGTAALDRRGRDLMNMANSRDMMFQILSNPELLGPEKFDDLVKKLKEYEDTLNAYLPRSDAEKATQQVLRVICLFNQNRAANSIIGWIPGMTSLLRNIGGLEIEHIQPFRALGEIGKKGGTNRLEKWANDNMISGRKVKDIPLCLSELVSLSVRFQGPEGNAWDEFKMTAFLNKIQRAGLFQNSPQLLNELKRELHATAGWRIFYGLPRKYWWVVPVATIALASAESLKEEKNKR